MLPPNPRLLRHTGNKFEPLASNSGFQYAARYAMAIYQANAVFSFIPKNACSTMRYSIGVANGAIAGPQDFDWIHANNQTFRPSLGEMARAQYSFTILRDPYLRLASCFLDKMVDQTDVSWLYTVATNRQVPPAMLTFRNFVTALKSKLRDNEHWRPQQDFLIYRDYDDYFSVERFSEAAAALQSRLGLVVLDARNLTRHGMDQFTQLAGDEFYADTPAHEIAALKRGGKIPRPAQLYDPELISQAGQLYAGDIEFYTKHIGQACIF